MSAQEYKNAGNKAFTEGRFQEAVDLFSKAIKEEENHVFYSNRSGAYASLKQYANALADAEKCIELSPSFVKGYSRQGAALFGLGRLADAKTAYQRGLSVDPTNSALKEGLNEVDAAVAARARSQDMFPGGNPLAKIFGPNMMTTLASNPQTSGFMRDPEFVDKMKQLQANPSLISSMRDPRIQTALQVLLMTGLGVDPSRNPFGGANANGGGPNGMGGMMGDDDDEPEEEPININAHHPNMRDQERSSSSSSTATPSQQEGGDKGQEGGQAQEEEEEYVDEELEKEKREREERRKKADEIKERGTAAYKQRNFDEAIKLYEEAFQTDDTNATYLNNIAAVLFERKEWDKCIEKCLQAADVARDHRNPSSVKAKVYLRLGNAYSKIERWGDAIEAYKKSAIEETSPQLRNLLKQAEINKKKQEENAYLDPVKSEEAKEKGKVI